MKADAEGFGIPLEATPSVEHFEVWEENWDAATVFLKCATQWRNSMGAYLGLEYGIIFELMSLYSIEDRVATFEAIQVIESEALTLLNKSD